MYIYGTYIPPLERASLSLILSSSHQAQNIIAKPLIAPSYDLSHIFPIFTTCTTLLSTAPLLCLSYCNPSCCPLATSHYNSQASTPRANSNMADQVVIDDNVSEVN